VDGSKPTVMDQEQMRCQDTTEQVDIDSRWARKQELGRF
jgi:hypothetical protein